LTDPVSLAVQEYIAGHQDNFGGLGPSVLQAAKDLLEEWPAPGPPAGWVTDAINQACANNARKWAYVKKILESWRDKGRAKRPQEQGARAGPLKTAAVPITNMSKDELDNLAGGSNGNAPKPGGTRGTPAGTSGGHGYPMGAS